MMEFHLRLGGGAAASFRGLKPPPSPNLVTPLLIALYLQYCWVADFRRATQCKARYCHHRKMSVCPSVCRSVYICYDDLSFRHIGFVIWKV